MGKKWQHSQILFPWGPKLLRTVNAATKLKDSFSLEEFYEKYRHCVKKQRYHVANKRPRSQSYGFSSSHVWMSFGPKRKLSAEEFMFLNCGTGEDS